MSTPLEPLPQPENLPVESVEAPAVPGGSLARRSVTSVTWNIIARTVKIPAGLVLSVILARLIPVEYFGIVAGLEAFIVLLAAVLDFGLVGAYFHRSPETMDEERATAVLFTLRIVFSAVWLAILIPVGLVVLTDVRRMVFLVWTVTLALMRIVDVPRFLLMRRVQHKLLAFFDVTAALLVLVISATIAYATHSIWALLVYPVVSVAWSFVLLFLIRPVWRPRWLWDRAAIRYYLNFGLRGMPGQVLGVALDHVDDLWTYVFLGDLAAGFYTRSYRFAVYPGIVLAEPVSMVTSATYAELKDDRARRSQTFFRVNALLIRSGFLLGGWFSVVAPELISIFLGEKWLPWVSAFRLMLVLSVLNPIKVTVSSVLVSQGKPEQVSLVRLIQLGVMLVGLFGLGFRLNIEGVALAVDLMLVVGMGLVFRLVRPYVDVSYTRLFLLPGIGLLLGLGLSALAPLIWNLSASDWLAVVVKSLFFALGYGGIILLFEGRLILSLVQEIRNLMPVGAPKR